MRCFRSIELISETCVCFYQNRLAVLCKNERKKTSQKKELFFFNENLCKTSYFRQ